LSIEETDGKGDAGFEIGGVSVVEGAEQQGEKFQEFASDLTKAIIENRETSGLNDPNFGGLKEAARARDEHIFQIVNAFIQINQTEIKSSTNQDAVLELLKSASASLKDSRSFFAQMQQEDLGGHNLSADEINYWTNEGLLLRHLVGSYAERATPSSLLPQGKTFSDEEQKNAFIAQRADKYLPVYNIIHAWSDGLAENSGALGKMGQLDQRNAQEFKQLTGISLQANEPTRGKNLDGAGQEQLEDQYLRQFAIASVFRAKIDREKSYRRRRDEIKNIEADITERRERLDVLRQAQTLSREQNPLAQKRQEVREKIFALALEGGIDLRDFDGTTNALLNSAIESLQRRRHFLSSDITQERATPRGFLAIVARSARTETQEAQSELEKINNLIEKIKSFREDAREMLLAETDQRDNFVSLESAENLQRAITDLETEIDTLDTQFQKLRNTQESGFRHFFGNALATISNLLYQLEMEQIDLASYQSSVGTYIDQIRGAIHESRVWIDEDFDDIPRQEAEEFIHLTQRTNWYNPDEAREIVEQYDRFRNSGQTRDDLSSILGQFKK